jgi:hypothetical protein
MLLKRNRVFVRQRYNLPLPKTIPNIAFIKPDITQKKMLGMAWLIWPGCFVANHLE